MGKTVVNGLWGPEKASFFFFVSLLLLVGQRSRKGRTTQGWEKEQKKPEPVVGAASQQPSHAHKHTTHRGLSKRLYRIAPGCSKREGKHRPGQGEKRLRSREREAAQGTRVAQSRRHLPQRRVSPPGRKAPFPSPPAPNGNGGRCNPRELLQGSRGENAGRVGPLWRPLRGCLPAPVQARHDAGTSPDPPAASPGRSGAPPGD